MRKATRKQRTKRVKVLLQKKWSLSVRGRDQECVLCGKTENLQAHHWIVHASGSLGTRFLVENGVTLCYGCHMFKVHARGDAETLDSIKKYMIPQFLTEDRYEEVKSLGRGISNVTLEELEGLSENWG